MKIPNFLITLCKGNTLKVACKLYSLVNENRISRNGYEVCVKQTTIAQSCGLSLSTVKRSISELFARNIITHRYRVTYENGHQGAYHYSLAFFSNYFYLRHDIFKYDLTAQEFTLYAAMSKLRTNRINSFYQSLNDLCRITDLNKSNICKLIRSINQRGLIYKQLKRTKIGDYTDNTYFVVVRLVGKIKKVSIFFKQLAFAYIVPKYNIIVNRKSAEFFVNNRKKRERESELFYKGGSG